MEKVRWVWSLNYKFLSLNFERSNFAINLHDHLINHHQCILLILKHFVWLRCFTQEALYRAVFYLAKCQSRSGPYVFMDLGSGVGKLVVQAGQKFRAVAVNRNVFWFCNDIVILCHIASENATGCKVFLLSLQFCDIQGIFGVAISATVGGNWDFSKACKVC